MHRFNEIPNDTTILKFTKRYIPHWCAKTERCNYNMVINVVYIYEINTYIVQIKSIHCALKQFYWETDSEAYRKPINFLHVVPIAQEKYHYVCTKRDTCGRNGGLGGFKPVLQTTNKPWEKFISIFLWLKALMSEQIEYFGRQVFFVNEASGTMQ